MEPHGPRTRRWKNAGLVRGRDPRARSRWILLLGLVALAAPVIAWLVQQMEYVRVRYEIEELRAQYERLEEMEQRLRIRRASLVTPTRVERTARRDLGLVQPPTEQVVVVRRTRVAEGTWLARAPDRP